MTPPPLVSIIIPAYNAEPFLREAVDSALAQTHRPVEVVVVDDGSTDGTNSVIGDLPAGIRTVSKINGGTASARNAGVRVATGAWVVFLDADDRLRPTYVSRCLEHLGGHPEASYVYTQEEFFGTHQQRSSYPVFDAERLVHTNFVNPSALLPMTLVRRHPFNEAQRTHEDWDFYLNLLRDGAYGVLLNEPLKEYRRHAGAKQEVAAAYQTRMPVARLRIHLRHRDLLGRRAAPVLFDDLRRVAKGAIGGLRTATSLTARRLVRR